ncbi:MAG: hypothetical protein WDA15_02410 [Trueperaceae bacterium]
MALAGLVAFTVAPQALTVATAQAAAPSSTPAAARAATDLWLRGDFAAAYEAAAADEGSAAAQRLAARAAADQAVYVLAAAGAGQEEQFEWLRRSVTAAERAVTLDPNASQAYVYLARGRGEIARRSGILQNLNVATELKRLFEKALELNPQDADALVGFGMWHLELVENGVGWLYGGKRDQVMPLVEAGVAAAPDQVNLRVEYATALRAFAQPELALEQLEAALALPARSAVDRAEQERARRLLNN